MRSPLQAGTKVRVENGRTEILYHGDVIADDGVNLKVRLFGLDRPYVFFDSERTEIIGTDVFTSW